MKKIFAILMLLVFTAQFVPAFVCQDTASECCVTDCGEDKSPEKMEKKWGGKKELKDYTAATAGAAIQAAAGFSHLHGSYSLSHAPASDILTPPPNKA